MSTVQFQKSRKRKSPEADLQRQLFRALAVLLPKDCFCTHFPLGGGGLEHGWRMKALGAVKGFPDVLLIYQSKAFCVELKSETGTLSIEQRATHDALRAAGAKVEVARCLEQALARIREFGIPLREVERAFGRVA